MERNSAQIGDKTEGIYKGGWIDFNKNGILDPYEDPSKPVEERVEDLLNRMTLEEKIGQLLFGSSEMISGFSGFRSSGDLRKDLEEINETQRKVIEGSRLGIPVLFVTECLHGCMAHLCTQFPQAIALAASWNPDLVNRVARAIARETKARGFRQCYSPVVNLARDVRCGRTEETYGEDPYLASVMASSFCRALRYEGVVATPKHFVANYMAEGGRDSHEVHLSERILRETEFQPFYSSLKAGALCVMAAYNSVDGIPCSCNKWLLTEVLRWEWGFQGYVVSDAWAVPGLLYKHGVFSKPEEAAAACLKSGLEVELPNVFWKEALAKALREGLVETEVLDDAVRRVLRTKILIGLFDEPFIDPEESIRVIGCEEHKKLAYGAAREGIVLLKNDGNLLPLDKKKLKRVLVVGGAAKSLKLGGYSGMPLKTVSPLEAIADKLSGSEAKLEYVEAIPLEMGCCNAIQIRNPNTGLPIIKLNYIAPPKGLEGNGIRVEIFDNPNFEGKPIVDYVGLNWVGFRYEWGYGKPHHQIETENYSVRFSGRLLPPINGRYSICLGVAGGKATLTVDGRVLVQVDATSVSTYKRVEVELAKKEHEFTLEYSRTRGYAAVRLGWDLVESEEMRKAVELASEADVVIFFAEVVEGEEEDRAILRLPKSKEKLIEKLLKVNPNLIVVLTTGGPVVGDWVYRVPCLVQAWYPGELGGLAVVDVLFGDYNPAGRLPFTWPHHEGQLPLYYNYKPSGRVYDYVNMTGAPLFPFGHGLSYTKFEYSNLKVETEEDGRVKISFEVENVGPLDGDEVVQLYIKDTVSRVARPVKELRRFQRVHLRKGQKSTLYFELEPDDFAYYNEEMRRVVEPGDFEILVGASSEDIRLRTKVELRKELRSKPLVKILDFKSQGGSLISLQAFIINEGPLADLIPVTLTVDEKEVEKHKVYLQAGESRTINFTFALDKGLHKVKVRLGESWDEKDYFIK
ncbi:MAG: glycoside hydrolase family 3 C-terminal domain-containing protein [Thermofilaceae archaeon]|nr:glycoside hydrolase family 3 C-terminal domain-containing protein [Thermofilaceae archaeon]MCX8181327.1 glycoside hydrolase family 3 C-terminal domain-containing protein [Thermofilaceae archaeon]MDW8003570.1 glycoside hydrolase family 3 N-terminal domain-containing protein [Thermofilaceae archaeon]